jgi:hypothetical protein
MSEEPQRKRSYKPGHRNGKQVAKQMGQLSRSRWGWVKVYFGQFVLWADYALDEENNETDVVQDIKLLYPIPKRPPVSWNLTACTEEELNSIKHLFDTAFALALPIVRERDKEAQDALDNGDDSHSRIYRQVPQLVYREGAVVEHGEGVQHGPADAAGVPRDADDPDGGLRGDEPDLVERDQG